MSEYTFGCGGCGRPLQQDYVEAVMPGGLMTFGRKVIVAYRCKCDSGRRRTQRYHATPEAIDKVTGGAGLPYRNARPLTPVPGDHPALLEWRDFIRKHGDDVDGFMRQLNG